jgi:hypothetical protein
VVAALASAVLFLLGARPPATRVAETATLGRVRAVLTYQRPSDGTDVLYARIRILRSGQLLLDERLLPPFSSGAVTPSDVWWFGSQRSKAVVIRDLDQDGEPEVLVNLRAGGAYELPYVYIYSYRPPRWFSRATYRAVEHTWGLVIRLVDLDRDRRPEFLTLDYRFHGRFASSAGSRLPIQIWQFRRGRLLDRTRRFPRAVARDLAAYRACLPGNARRGEDERGCLAGWAGDMALLGRSRRIWPVLAAARANENLGPVLGEIYPSGEHYIARLRKFLRETGYLR